MSADLLREAARKIREDCPIPESSRGYDFIDFPTGWAIQRAGIEHIEAACSAAQTKALLCDCGALYPAWRRWRTLLAVADWLDACAQFLADEPAYTHDGEDYALTVAVNYLGRADS